MSNAFENMIKLYDIVSVRDFGAKGDGVTDDKERRANERHRRHCSRHPDVSSDFC